MTTTTNTTAQKNLTNIRLFVLFVLVMLSSTGVFGQNTTTTLSTTTSTEVSATKEATMVIATENAIASMDFAVWFMGVKKTSDAASTAAFSKKQLINSGIKTNNMLIRTFLKKVSTQENSVA